MHRIDGPTAAAGGQFTEGSPSGGVPATIVSDDWLNDVQNNICYAIEQAGITLAKGDQTQLMKAILALVGQGPESLIAAGGYKKFGKIIVNWGQKTTAAGTQRASVVHAAAYPNGTLWTGGVHYGQGGAIFVVDPSSVSNTGFDFLVATAFNGVATGAFLGAYLSIGW